MRPLSRWAHGHPRMARLLIVLLLYPLLNASAWLLGAAFETDGLQFSSFWDPALSLFLLALVLLFPSVRNYRLRMTVHLLLAALTWTFVFLSGNEAGQESPVRSTGYFSTAAATETHPSGKPSVRKSMKGFVKGFRVWWKKKSDGEKAALIALTVILSLLVILALGGLACSIACSGSEGLGYAVFILGTAGVVVGAIAIIRNISRKESRKQKAGSSS